MVALASGITFDAREPPPPELNRDDIRASSVQVPEASHLLNRDIASSGTSERSLPLLAVSLAAQVVYYTIRVSLMQKFWNESSSDIPHARYTFPLYDNSTVIGFTCYIGNRKTVKGIVKPRGAARSLYNKAVSEHRTAGLLERNTPEIFTTTLGSIPARTRVKVEITYITVLKYDSFSGGRIMTLTIPTSVAPRYGTPPAEYPEDSHEVQVMKGLEISVGVMVPVNIEGLESSTHPIAVKIGTNGSERGRWDDLETRNTPDPKRALATLSDSSASLGRDFVLSITMTTGHGLETPHALLETHLDPDNHYALMMTIPPHVVLRDVPLAPNGEIVFVADRSGSMADKIKTLRSAMQIFLKSIPTGRKFNIWSFGSNYSCLWDHSRQYSEEALSAALTHVRKSFKADMGGTELLEALRAVVNTKVDDLTTEIITLTDGEVWHQKETIEFVRQTRNRFKGRMRFFSLGVGNAVSHGLIEGIAREGGGYAEVVSADGRGRWEDRVVSMLKAALTMHLGPFRIELVNSPLGEHAVRGSHSQDRVHKMAETRLPHPLELERPDFLQAPFDISAMNPFVRNNIFILFEAVWLSPSWKEIKITTTALTGKVHTISLPVIPLERKDSTIHKLGARALMSDLESRQSWIHLGSYGASQNGSQELEDLVRTEGERLGCKWSIAGKWTSFIAVEEIRETESILRHQQYEPPPMDENEELYLLHRRGTLQTGSHPSGRLIHGGPADGEEHSDSDSNMDDDVDPPVPIRPPRRRLCVPSDSNSADETGGGSTYGSTGGSNGGSQYKPKNTNDTDPKFKPLTEPTAMHAGFPRQYHTPPSPQPSRSPSPPSELPWSYRGEAPSALPDLAGEYNPRVASPGRTGSWSQKRESGQGGGGSHRGRVLPGYYCPAQYLPQDYKRATQGRNTTRLPTQNLGTMTTPLSNPSAPTILQINKGAGDKSTEDLINERVIRDVVSLQRYDGAFDDTLPPHTQRALGSDIDDIRSLMASYLKWMPTSPKFAVCATVIVVVCIQEYFQSQKDLWELVIRKAMDYVEWEFQNREDREYLYCLARCLILRRNLKNSTAWSDFLQLRPSVTPLGGDGTPNSASPQVSLSSETITLGSMSSGYRPYP